MKIYKSKLKKIINFIRYESKFKRGDIVKIKKLTDNKNYDFYKKYIGKYGKVVCLNFAYKDFIVEVAFENDVGLNFKPDEIEKIPYSFKIDRITRNIKY